MNRKQKSRWWPLVACLLAMTLAVAVGSGSSRGASKTMWVAVMEDSTDAVILKKADRFADVVGLLKFNQQVEVMRDLSEDKDNPRPYFSVKINGVSGFVKQSALAEKSQYQGEKKDSEASVATGSSAANTAAKGLNSQNEKTLSQSDPAFKARVEEVDKMEKTINQLVYGSEQPDPRKGLDNYRAWGDEGLNIAKDNGSEK